MLEKGFFSNLLRATKGAMPKSIVSVMLRQGLYTRVIGRRVVHFQRLSSTMDEAAREARQGAEDGTVIVAEAQTAGRGRFQRSWVSDAGNLYLSIVLRPSLQVLPYVSIMSGVAVARAIRKATGLRPTIKWPNDVRIHGKKVCGILVENAIRGDNVDYAVVGIGVNVGFDPTTVEELSDIAISLNAAAGKPVDRPTLLTYLLQEMDNLYIALRQAHEPAAQDIIEDWRSLLDTLGTQVEVRWGPEVYSGCAQDVDGLGNLLLRLADGSVATLPAGEVTSVRLAETAVRHTPD